MKTYNESNKIYIIIEKLQEGGVRVTSEHN